MEKESWHLSKSVPISLIFAVALQTAGILWYVAALDGNVESNARDIARHEVRLMSLEKSVQSLEIVMARMDENVKSIRVMMERDRQ
tara:strand:+ start:557 stop:814 length:258 start_codon:yes stop_codon:yes gene_type:complete